MSQVAEIAVVLAGGAANFHGFVLAPYPKILLPLANHPLLHYQARVLAEAGGKRLIVCVNNGMGARVAEHLGSLPHTLEYLIKETTYGTGGSLKEVEDAIAGSLFWVLGGDVLLSTGYLPALRRAFPKAHIEASDLDFGYAATLSVVLLVIMLVFTALYLKFT